MSFNRGDLAEPETALSHDEPHEQDAKTAKTAKVITGKGGEPHRRGQR